jgi:hypothetical protein
MTEPKAGERTDMGSLMDLPASLAEQPSVEASVDVLVRSLAQRIKAASNDQNIQRLARDLTAAAPAIVRAVAARPSTAG